MDKIAIGLERVETYKSFNPKGLHRLGRRERGVGRSKETIECTGTSPGIYLPSQLSDESPPVFTVRSDVF